MALINVSTRYVKHNHHTPPLSLSLYFLISIKHWSVFSNIYIRYKEVISNGFLTKQQSSFCAVLYSQRDSCRL